MGTGQDAEEYSRPGRSWQLLVRGTANWTCCTPDQLRAVCGLVVGLAAGYGRPLVVRVDRVVSAHWLESSCPECWRRTRNQRPAQSRVVDPGALGCGEGKGHPEQWALDAFLPKVLHFVPIPSQSLPSASENQLSVLRTALCRNQTILLREISLYGQPTGL